MTINTSTRLQPLMSHARDEWYTPKTLLQRVERALVRIDLDPCAEPARRVPAATHYTANEDGLSREWHGTVFVNPPYSAAAEWLDKLDAEYRAGRVTKAIALIPARTDTQWWHRNVPDLWCAVEGRLRFSNASNSAPFPSALWYFGDGYGAMDFIEEMCPIGQIWRRYA